MERHARGPVRQHGLLDSNAIAKFSHGEGVKSWNWHLKPFRAVNQNAPQSPPAHAPSAEKAQLAQTAPEVEGSITLAAPTFQNTPAKE